MFFEQHWVETKSSFLCIRKSLSWHTALRIRRKSEKRDKEGRKMENGYRKPQDNLANKVSVKVDSREITLHLITFNKYNLFFVFSITASESQFHSRWYGPVLNNHIKKKLCMVLKNWETNFEYKFSSFSIFSRIPHPCRRCSMWERRYCDSEV